MALFRSSLAAVLTVLVAAPPLPAELFHHRDHAGTLAPDQRILHTLNRFTFGPRPGDLEAVKRMGLDRWFEQQLNPHSIDDSALDGRLASFPAMSLPQPELLRHYPNPQLLRLVIDRKAPIPSDPVEHAIYTDSIAFYEQARLRREALKGTTPAEPQMTSGLSAADQAVMQQMRGRGVDLLAGDPASEPFRRKGKGGETDSLASSAAQSAGDMTAASPPPPPERGRPRHSETDFPEAETEAILGLAPEARLTRILAFSPADLVRFRESLSQAELVALVKDLSPAQKETLGALQNPERLVGTELLESRLIRDVYSNRQLEAVMTDFWLNHFNVYLRKNQNEPFLLPAFERETIRPHALGRFEDLLVATAQSPAMLMYLDNWQSIGPDSPAATRGARLAPLIRNQQVKQAVKERGLNENYARELLELHTLGVRCEVSKDHAARSLDHSCGAGYTQADVTAVAQVFTGWTIDRPNQGGSYSFELRRHQPGPKVVLGSEIAEGGEREGLDLLHRLANSPATARFISTKLAIRFVSDNPPPELIDQMCATWLKTGGDIRSVLRTLYRSREFSSPSAVRAKVKTPIEFLTSSLRATGAEITSAAPLVLALDRLGMPLYGMPTPNGYSWLAEPWVSSGALVTRMNFALVLSTGRVPGTSTGFSNLLQPSAVNPKAKIVALTAPAPAASSTELRLEQLLLGRPASDRTRAAVLAQASDASGVAQQAELQLALRPAARGPLSPAAPDAEGAIMAGLLLGSPEFQRR